MEGITLAGLNKKLKGDTRTQAILHKMEELIDMITGNKFNISIILSDDGVNILMLFDYNFEFMNDGVSGTENIAPSPKYSVGDPKSFKDKMPPHSSFSRYTSNIQIQYAIAKKIQREGLIPQNYLEQFVTDTRFIGLLGTLYDAAIEALSDAAFEALMINLDNTLNIE